MPLWSWRRWRISISLGRRCKPSAGIGERAWMRSLLPRPRGPWTREVGPEHRVLLNESRSHAGRKRWSRRAGIRPPAVRASDMPALQNGDGACRAVERSLPRPCLCPPGTPPAPPPTDRSRRPYAFGGLLPYTVRSGRCIRPQGRMRIEGRQRWAVPRERGRRVADDPGTR